MTWEVVKRCDPRARALADRHYSRQTRGAREFMPPGRTLVLLSSGGDALWGVSQNLDPGGALRWRVSIFRNESPTLSSVLVEDATIRTYEYWSDHYGAVPERSLTTEVDPERTRKKRDPGRCFLRAGWARVELRRGLVVLAAEPARL